MCSGPEAVAGHWLSFLRRSASVVRPWQASTGSPRLLASVLTHRVSLWHPLPGCLWHVFRPWAPLLWAVSSAASLRLLLGPPCPRMSADRVGAWQFLARCWSASPSSHHATSSEALVRLIPSPRTRELSTAGAGQPGCLPSCRLSIPALQWLCLLAKLAGNNTRALYVHFLVLVGISGEEPSSSAVRIL